MSCNKQVLGQGRYWYKKLNISSTNYLTGFFAQCDIIKMLNGENRCLIAWTFKFAELSPSDYFHDFSFLQANIYLKKPMF